MLQSRNRAILHSHENPHFVQLAALLQLQSRNRAILHSHIIGNEADTAASDVAIPQSGNSPFSQSTNPPACVGRIVAIPQSGNSPFSPYIHGWCIDAMAEVAIPQSGNSPFSRRRRPRRYHDLVVAIPQSGNSPFSLCYRAVAARSESSKASRLQSRNRAILHSHPDASNQATKTQVLQSRNRAILHSHLTPEIDMKDPVSGLQSRNRAILHSHVCGYILRERPDWIVAIPQSGNSPFSL